MYVITQCTTFLRSYRLCTANHFSFHFLVKTFFNRFKNETHQISDHRQDSETFFGDSEAPATPGKKS